MLPEPLSRIYPFVSRELVVNGLHYRYVDEGSGEPIVCVHGNPTWSFFFRRLIRLFCSEYRVIAPDHIGCGLSDKPQDYPYNLGQHIDNLERLILALNLKDITLVVHDWGGPIGLGVAVRRPEIFSRLVILNTAVFPPERIPWLLRLARVPGLGEVLIRGLNAFVRLTLVTAVYHKEWITPEVRLGYLYPYDSWEHRIANHRFVMDIPVSSDHISYSTLASVNAGLTRLANLPVMIAWGMRDWVFPGKFIDFWLRNFPRAVVHKYQDAHHLLLEDAPEFFNDFKHFLCQDKGRE